MEQPLKQEKLHSFKYQDYFDIYNLIQGAVITVKDSKRAVELLTILENNMEVLKEKNIDV